MPVSEPLVAPPSLAELLLVWLLSPASMPFVGQTFLEAAWRISRKKIESRI
jgi:hypothetical protein